MTGFVETDKLLLELKEALTEPYQNSYDRNMTEVIIRQLTVSCRDCKYADQSGFLDPCRECAVMKRCYYQKK